MDPIDKEIEPLQVGWEEPIYTTERITWTHSIKGTTLNKIKNEWEWECGIPNPLIQYPYILKIQMKIKSFSLSLGIYCSFLISYSNTTLADNSSNMADSK